MPYDQDGNWLGAFEGQGVDETTQLREEYQATERWLVDPIFPAGAMHLIGGPSGSGKTTWLLQQLWEWEQGLPLFGKYKSNPCRWVYICCDRSLRETDKTLQRLGYHDWKFPAYSLEDLLPHEKVLGIPGAERINTNPDIISHVLFKFPDVELFVIEGLQALMPDMQKGRSQNKQELLWALSLRLHLGPLNKTIIATTHSPKVAAAGGVAQDARTKFLGSQGFIGTCSTMVGVDAVVDKDGKKTNQRQIKVMGRNFADVDLTYSLDEWGRFNLEGEDGEVVPGDDDYQMKILSLASRTGEFTTAEAHQTCGLDVSLRTVQRILGELVKEGTLSVAKEHGKKAVFVLAGRKQ